MPYHVFVTTVRCGLCNQKMEKGQFNHEYGDRFKCMKCGNITFIWKED